MCSTHAHGQDDRGGPGGACVCEGGSVLKVTEHVEDVFSLGKHHLACVTCILIFCTMFQRHPVMAKWPVGHKWFFMKLELIQIWLQDWVGGTTLIPLEDYFKATPF